MLCFTIFDVVSPVGAVEDSILPTSGQIFFLSGDVARMITVNILPLDFLQGYKVFASLLITVAYYLQMTIGVVGIYCLLFLCFCVCVSAKIFVTDISGMVSACGDITWHTCFAICLIL